MKAAARLGSGFLFILLSCQILFSTASAAPPTITYLYPAGAQRGTSVEVTAAGTLDTATKVWASGKGVAVEAAKGKWKVTVAKDAVPGVYWLRAHNAEGASSLRPFIVGTLPEVAEKETNDDPKKAQVLERSCVVNGKLAKSGDVDCFAMKLKKGETLVAALEAHDTLRSPMDGMLQILSADGFVLAENNDFHGLDPRIAFTAKHDGTYLARVYAFPATPTSSIRHFGSDECVYRLTLTTGPFADYVMPLAVRGDGGRAAEVHGWNLPVLAVTQMRFAAEPGEPFATAFSEQVPNPLRVRRESHPVYTSNPKAPPAPPLSFSGRIKKPGEEVAVPLRAKKGQALTLQVESRALGLAVNPVVRVLDADGKQLARAEPGKLNTDITLAFNPPADGVYTVAVSDLFRGATNRHAFLLRVLSEPDYELTVAADRFALAPGKPTLIPVKVSRARGFRKDIEIVAEGLPEGVKLEVTPPKKGDANTITLSLTAEKPAGGPFRLVGQVKGEPELTRVARFTLPDFGEETADLWLAPTAQEPPKKKK